MGLYTYNHIHTHTSQKKWSFCLKDVDNWTLEPMVSTSNIRTNQRWAPQRGPNLSEAEFRPPLHASHQKRCFIFWKQCWLQMICLDIVYSCIFWVSKVHEYPAESMLFRKWDCELQWISRMKAEWLWIQCVCMYMHVPVLKTALMILDPLTIIDHILIRSHKYILYIPLYCL